MNAPRSLFREYDYLTEISGFDPVTHSAQVVVPLLTERFQPASVLDMGCGTGIWLSVFQQQSGVKRIRGCDGPWVPRDKLRIPADCFCPVDFQGQWPEPERVDLAVSLEVGEHVGAAEGAQLVDYLCRCADVVCWSAAIPGQGGHGHVNERYQEYWLGLFRERGFAAFDLIRPVVWSDRRVSVWYRQNCLVFANATGQAAHGLVPHPFVASVVHPELYERDRDAKNYSLATIARHLPHYLKRRFTGR